MQVWQLAFTRTLDKVHRFSGMSLNLNCLNAEGTPAAVVNANRRWAAVSPENSDLFAGPAAWRLYEYVALRHVYSPHTVERLPVARLQDARHRDLVIQSTR